MARGALAPLVLLGIFSACSTIVGADFDDKTQGQPSTQGLSGAPSSGGSSATLGGSSSGGTTTLGGSGQGVVQGGGSQGGGSQGGGGGGVAAGGAPALGGAAGTGGSLVASGGRASEGGTGGMLAGAGGDGGNAGSAGGIGTGGAGGGDAGAGAAAGSGGDGGVGGGPGEGVVVLNEVRGQGAGDDYIELVNRGPGVAHLGGQSISDSDLTHRVVFSNTTVLNPGGYLLILLNQTQTRETTCFTPNPCLHVTWGVSNNGEAVFLRSAANAVLDTTVYPDQAGPNGLTDAQSWGRFPDATGPFQATIPTAEAPNQL